MGPKEAAVACRLLKPKAVVPMHYGTWPLLTGTPEAFKKELTGQKIEIIEMKPGQTIG
jgi:L-ascorbate metabolism protein UlaG (beta-lactamase superfamily)